MKKQLTRQEDGRFFTRKNLLAFSLTAFYSVLLIAVAVCLDRSEVAIADEDNFFARLAGLLFGGAQIRAGAAGLVYVVLVALYLLLFAVALAFEMRLAHLKGRSRRSPAMIALYIGTFALCILLSAGLGLIVQPDLTWERVASLLFFLGQCLAVSALTYLGVGGVVLALVSFIVNLLKIEKPAKPLGREISNATQNEGTMSEVQPLESAVFPKEEAPLTREKVFPTLCAIDEKYAGGGVQKAKGEVKDLRALCDGFRSYLAEKEHLYYDACTVRMFVCGLRAGSLLLLEGLSGTGKSSLPRAFARYIGGKSRFFAVQATWRDRTDLLGYFNDFSKTYAETDFLSALYEAGYDRDGLWFFVLDEMNVSRVEYYFADFLSVLEYPPEERRLRIMNLPLGFLPPTMLEDGCVRIPSNCFFVGTANQDDSTYTISDKVYDRAISIEFERRALPFVAEGGEPVSLGAEELRSLFSAAEARAENALTAEELAAFTRVTDFLYTELGVAFGNRVFNQIQTIVPCYVACGGTKEEALDFMLARKAIKKLEGRYEDRTHDGLLRLKELLAEQYGSGTFARSEALIARLLGKLG